jgi:ADP-ribose pyrophosphatase YjhB (NUDIX family)
MFKYCPVCASQKITMREGKYVSCPDCGLVYYHNTAAASGAIIECGEKILLLERAREPAAGKLDLPGGFADPGEGIVRALARECREELGWQPPEEDFRFLTSFANVYPYKGFVYNTCDVFFVIPARGCTEESFTPQKSEVRRIVFARIEDVNEDDIAFVSAKNALRYYGLVRKTGRLPNSPCGFAAKGRETRFFKGCCPETEVSEQLVL